MFLDSSRIVCAGRRSFFTHTFARHQPDSKNGSVRIRTSVGTGRYSLNRTPRKLDAKEIREFLEELAGSMSPNDARREWPHYLFHMTDIENVFSILQEGALYSRARLRGTNSLVHDSAHSEVIHQTSDYFKDCVRLYFRPRTPTLYSMEGFRPQDERKINRQGISVILVFDSSEVLTRLDTQFTNGNAASSECFVGDNAVFLRSIPFQDVYHDWGMPSDRKSELKFRRNAEVLVPGTLDLEPALKWIMVRSVAERETLVFRLGQTIPSQLERYRRRTRAITLSSRTTSLFDRKWTFVEQVSVADGFVTFKFSDDSEAPGPFAIQILVSNRDETVVYSNWVEQDQYLTGTLRATLPRACAIQAFVVELKIDGRAAYKNVFLPSDTALLY